MEKEQKTVGKRKTAPILYVVVPCYNEESVLPVTSKIFLEKLQGMIGRKKIKDESRILFVNDGSRDSTWELIRSLAREDRHYGGDLPEPEPRPSECGSGRADDCKICLRHNHND